ncbi:MAG: Stp1/IreP family PP2C-type Ser/Thr phosphatase [Actinomycetota bacterium]
MSNRVDWGACTDVGLVRRVNEDSKCHEYPLFAVADGMGGHSAGDVASALAIETVSERIGGSESLSDAVRAANQEIFRRASQEPELSGMGTTLTAMVAGDTSAQIAHVGDSRAYLLRNGELTRLTQDHTVVGRLVQQGRIRPEDADRHPQRSYLDRALGVDSDVEVDVYMLDFEPGDRVMLCSDGLFGMVEDDLIASVLTEQSDPQKAAEQLCAAAVKAGGNDNVTTVVVDFPRQAAPAAAGPPAAEQRSKTEGVRTDTGPLPGAGSTQPAPPPGPQNARGESGAPQQPSGTTKPKRRTWRILRYASVIVVVLAAGAFAARMSLEGSWYVGTNDGRVSIFSGVPGSLGGLTFSDLERETDLSLNDIPEPHRSRLEDGIKADSRASAEEIVANLTRLSAPEADPEPTQTPTPAATGSPQDS